MKIELSKKFKKDYKKIKDKFLRLKIHKEIGKLKDSPEIGKPLKNQLKGYRCLRIKPFRIIYRIENDKIIINCFDHRKNIYKPRVKLLNFISLFLIK